MTDKTPYAFPLLTMLCLIIGAIVLGAAQVERRKTIMQTHESQMLSKGFVIDQCVRQKVMETCVVSIRRRFSNDDITSPQLQECRETALQVAIRSYNKDTDSDNLNPCLLKQPTEITP